MQRRDDPLLVPETQSPCQQYRQRPVEPGGQRCVAFEQLVEPLENESRDLVCGDRRGARRRAVQERDLPDDLTRKLRKILLYDNYDLEAQALLQPIEGESVTYEIGEGYQVAFRLGTVLPDRRVRLADFAVGRHLPRRQAQELLHTNLNLWLDQTMSLGLAKSEGSREALMVVLTLKDGERRP